MKQFILILFTLSLTGCSMMPKLTSAKPKWPDAYIDDKTQQQPKCEDLKQVPADVNNMSAVFKIIVENYTLYWKCSNHVDSWNEWYEEQKRIYESK